MNINPELVKLAEWRLSEIRKQAATDKTAFVPPGGDPSGGAGGPPSDASGAGGGPPPGVAPPTDPSQMGGMDPSQMGGGGPVAGGGGLTADSIAQIVSQTMQQQQGGMAGG